ncbi:hypothetical protein [Flexithrix dorotheae]|uniref:hypothetical protein n=1 Tax=Flexithrix dorotheae TaxID=70993 RepID=UPI0003655D26|nr:hypothetical protein [Flexithrix dorotheae]
MRKAPIWIEFKHVENVFWNLNDAYKLLLTKSEIMFVLMKLQEYYQKSEENEINETAFLDVYQYITRATNIAGFSTSKTAIKHILETETACYTQKAGMGII